MIIIVFHNKGVYKGFAYYSESVQLNAFSRKNSKTCPVFHHKIRKSSDPQSTMLNTCLYCHWVSKLMKYRYKTFTEHKYVMIFHFLIKRIQNSYPKEIDKICEKHFGLGVMGKC